jgi:hypothetical protein
LPVFEPGRRTRLLVGRSIPAGIAGLLLILLGIWHFADDDFLPAVALAMLVLGLAAFCPEPS